MNIKIDSIYNIHNNNILTMLPILASLWTWLSAFAVVCTPFIEMGLIWLGWQVGLGWLAWSTARFYSSNCAPPGTHGFVSSLFTMGSPVCIGTWFSHATFVIAYITAFVVAVLLVTLWLWNRVTQDSTVKKLQKELAALQGKMKDTSPELEQTQHVSDEIQL